MRLLARPRTVPLWIGLLLVSVAGAAGPIVHERFEQDAAEDLRLGATTASGAMPAAIQTQSGLIAAPEEGQRVSQEPRAPYGGARTPDSPDANYHIDRLTTRPERVKYDEPFRPSILPFKRLYAFDLLKEDFSFGVRGRDVTLVPVGGVAEDSEDTFFSDLEVDLVAGVPVRIPSIGPGARVRALHVDPPQPVSIVEDGAENWFVRAQTGGRSRLVMHLSIPRKTFGGAFAPVSTEALAPYLTPLPESAREAALRVAEHIGVDPHASPAQMMIGLVHYFRKFQESDELPVSSLAAELYEELAQSQKGVCRHRAYAFAITALGLGLPTRLVHNEAHAWVEVFDSFLWHRVDLGGAASEIQDTNADPLLPLHRPPGDPYSWPQGATPGLSAGMSAARTASALEQGNAASSRADPQDRGPRPGDVTQGSGAADASANEPSDLARVGVVRALSQAPPPVLSLAVKQSSLLRGHPLGVSGTARREGKPCRFSRVDIFLLEGSSRTAIGSLSTDAQGKFQGQVTVPLATQVGRVSAVAEVAGGCS